MSTMNTMTKISEVEDPDLQDAKNVFANFYDSGTSRDSGKSNFPFSKPSSSRKKITLTNMRSRSPELLEKHRVPPTVIPNGNFDSETSIR